MKLIKKFAARTFACLVVGLLVVGCASSSTDEPLQPIDPDDALVEIVLNGGISLAVDPGTPVVASVPSDTRAVVNAEHGELPISILRRDQSGDPLTYPAYKDGTVLSAKLAASSSSDFVSGITFDVTQYYLPDAAKKTKLIGWHPQNTPDSETDKKVSFSTTDGTVSFEVDGASDIMLSTEPEGGKADADKFNTDEAKQLKFSHLLTQVQIKAYAADETAKTKWGKIKSVKLKDEGGKTCKVTLAENNASTESFVAPTTATDLTLAQETAGEVELGVGSANAVKCGYAMFQPTASGAATPLTLLVETENGGTSTVAINSDKVASFDKGKAYTLTLKLTVTGFDLKGQITDWENHSWGTGEGDFNGEIEL